MPRVPAPSTALATRLVVVLAGLVALLVLSGCSRAGGEVFQPTLNTAVTLEPDTTVGQSFNPVGDAVQAVDLHVATFAAPADPDGVLTVTLVDAASGAVLDTTQVAGDSLHDGAWVRADFGQPVTVPTVAVVEVAWRGSSPVALWANTPPADQAPVDVVNDPYPHGQLVRDGRPADGDLAFRVVTGEGPTAVVGQTVEVARSAVSRLAAQPVFTVLWALAVVGSAVMAVLGLRRRSATAPRAPATATDPSAR